MTDISPRPLGDAIGPSRPVGAVARFGVLTVRESQVLALVADRYGNAEIAGRLGISKRTVESHVAALRRKLGAGDRAVLRQLGAVAADQGGPDGNKKIDTSIRLRAIRLRRRAATASAGAADLCARSARAQRTAQHLNRAWRAGRVPPAAAGPVSAPTICG